MKILRLFLTAILLVSFGLFATPSYASDGYGATCLTGGTTGCLDAINGALLSDGDKALVTTATQFYVYNLNATSGAVESSPSVISPDTNAGTKRWILVSQSSATVSGMIELATGAETKAGTDAARAVTPDGLNDVLGQADLVAGDIPYSAVATTLTRLAKGTADTKMFMNAGATAPEWAAGIKIGTFTRDAAAVSGDVAYTGVGFKPSLVLFDMGVAAGSYVYSYGMDDGTTHFSIISNEAISATTVVASTGASIGCITGAGVSQQGIIKTMDADGFTITWTKAGSPTGTLVVGYKAFR